MAAFEDLQNDTSTNRIVIVGGGIVGSALAFYLSKSKLGKQIVVLDKSLSPLLGSTSHAPGFVGQLNTSTILTSLAKASVREYTAIPGGFDTVGGLEIASTSEGAETLKPRYELARQAGLPAEIVASREAADLAPDFIKSESCFSALHFASDGTANSGIITDYFRQNAEAQGVLFVEAAVSGIESENGVVTGVSTPKGVLRTDFSQVILATGIWTGSLLSNFKTQSPIPVIPVAHPYTFSKPRARREGKPYPFVRWPEQHVYARDHGDCDGFGSYDHPSLRVNSLSDSAVGNWPQNFEAVLAEGARTCLKNGSEFLTAGGYTSHDVSTQRKPFNGIFAVTPDNLPLAGKATGAENLWICAAVWVTQAAGVAALIARELLRDQSGVREDASSLEDEPLLKALDPSRFAGGDEAALSRQALSTYNDIYNSDLLT